jgi:DNA-binding transcriptional MerR regulator
MNHPDIRKHMSIKQAADMLGVSIATMRRWDREGRLSPSGRTLGGWRYYLFTDLRTILDDLVLKHQKEILQQRSETMAIDAMESLAALKATSGATHGAAYRLPLRTKRTGPSFSEEQSGLSMLDKAQKLLDAVRDENYEIAADVLADIANDLKSAN